MKTVKSLNDLKQMALTRGAAVEVGTSRYNTEGQKIAALTRKPQFRSEPSEPKLEPKPESKPETTVNVDTAPIAAAQERVAQLLAQAIASIPQPAAPVREWVFTVERDEKGLLTGIRASAQS